MDNRFYDMLLGEEDDLVGSAPEWKLEFVHNEGGIPDRYQWFHEEEGKEERPIMTNSDMALVRDLTGHIGMDEDMAGIALFLASKAGAYLNGTVTPVDGGIHLKAHDLI